MAAFEPTIKVSQQAIGAKAFRPARALDAAVFDAVMVSVARRLSNGPLVDMASLRDQYFILLGQSAFVQVAGRATADEESVAKTLRLATSVFADARWYANGAPKRRPCTVKG